MALSPLFCDYSKICLKRPLKRRPKIKFSRWIIAKCRSKVLQNAPSAPMDHSAVVLTCIKVPHGFKTFVFLFLIGCLRQVSLYMHLCVHDGSIST